MKIRIPLAGILPALVGLCASTLPSTAQNAQMSVIVQPSERQTFKFFGFGLNGPQVETLLADPGKKAEVKRMIYDDLNTRALRLWYNGSAIDNDFLAWYVNSGVVAGAKAHGVGTILLAPWNTSPPTQQRYNDYASFIKMLQTNYGIRVDVSGITNESNWTGTQLINAVNYYRSALEAAGLNTKIVMPDSPNADGYWSSRINEVRANPTAWSKIVGVASHSYDNAANNEWANYSLIDGKEYWQTECGVGYGSEEMTAAAVFLNDLNHMVDHWFWFIGAHEEQDGHNPYRLLVLKSDGSGYYANPKYYALRHLLRVFYPGAVFRYCETSLQGDMTWTAGTKPMINMAAAQNVDGSWAFAVTNNTPISSWAATTYDISVEIRDLEGTGTLVGEVRRTSKTLSSNDTLEGTVNIVNGRARLNNLAPGDIVSIRTAGHPGLRAEFFDLSGSPAVMPNLSGVTPDVTRTDSVVNYPSTANVWPGLPNSMSDTFASRHTGAIRIPTSGLYTFYVNSDDGSKLWIDEELVVDNDGLHGMNELSGQKYLPAGLHTVRLDFFENTGLAGLVLSYSGPGIAKQIVPASILFHRKAHALTGQSFESPRTPLADASISNVEPGTNAGWNTIIRAENKYGAYRAKSYLRFGLNASGAGSMIPSSARLTLTPAYWDDDGSGTRSFDVFAIRDGDPADAAGGWSESSVTWNNAPANEVATNGFDPARTTFLGTWVMPAAVSPGQQIHFSSPALLNAISNDTNGSLTVMLRNNSASWANSTWWSKETTELVSRPALVIQFDSISAPPPGITVDSVTQGSWTGNYGGTGRTVAGSLTSLPQSISIVPAGHLNWVWNASTQEIRALQRPGGSDRLAACWYSANSFTFDVNCADGQPHQIALYCVDWDSQSRTQRIEILKTGSQQVLATQDLTNFVGGKWVVFDLLGQCTIRVTKTGGANAVVSGIFVD